MKYVYLTLIIILIFAIYYYLFSQKKEGFNQDSGQFCNTCDEKSFNSCSNCFNCGFCVDRFGNGKCIGGNASEGPLNKEDCALWYTGDQWTVAKQHNDNYKLSYGPKQANRVIGIYPCT